MINTSKLSLRAFKSKKNEQWLLILVFLAVAFIILAPLLNSGYVLALDMIFVDAISLPRTTNPEYLFLGLLHFLNLFLPTEVIQKIILGLSVFLAGVGAYMFSVYFLEEKHTEIRYDAYLAGLIYTLNPFTYSRFVAGQYNILLGYALLPFFLLLLFKFFNNPSWKLASYTAVVLFVIGIISIQVLGICLIVMLPIVVVNVYIYLKNRRPLKTICVRLGFIAALFFILSANWLIPLATGDNETNQIINSFSQSDYAAFATNGDTLGVIGNVLAMQGFWADGANLYLVPQDIYWWWWVPIFALWILVGIGFYSSWQKMKSFTVTFIAILSSAIILASGTNGSVFAPFNEWLVASMPLFAGYREPQKFVSVIVLIYALFGALGLKQIIIWLQKYYFAKWYVNLIAVSFLIIPIAIAPLMPWGFAGQLKTAHYPRDWYAMNSYLEKNVSSSDTILALPWHMYMRFGFTGSVVANPMDKFFTHTIIVSNNPELKEAKAYLSTEAQNALDKEILPYAPTRFDIGARLRNYGVGYILLAKEYDYDKYSYLNQQDDLVLMHENDHLILYKTQPVGQNH